MFIKKAAVIAFALMIVLGGVPGGCGQEPPPSNGTVLSAAWCQKTVDEFRNLDKGKFPDYLAKDNSSKTGKEFDVSGYFKVLTHLSMEQGYVLDWVYDFNGSGGSPVLYARQGSQPPFTNQSDFAEAANSVTRPENDISLVWLTKDTGGSTFGNKIKIDGSNEGYFEYTVLQILGSQFYLWWHANYNDAVIICEPDELERVIESVNKSDFGNPIDDNFIGKARKTDLQAYVTDNNGNVTVSVVIFSKWGGLARYSFTIDKDTPHSVTGFEREELVKYECGVLF